MRHLRDHLRGEPVTSGADLIAFEEAPSLITHFKRITTHPHIISWCVSSISFHICLAILLTNVLDSTLLSYTTDSAVIVISVSACIPCVMWWCLSSIISDIFPEFVWSTHRILHSYHSPLDSVHTIDSAVVVVSACWHEIPEGACIPIRMQKVFQLVGACWLDHGVWSDEDSALRHNNWWGTFEITFGVNRWPRGQI